MIARVIAFFAGLFTLLNLGGNLLWRGFDAANQIGLSAGGERCFKIPAVG
jgi:hypothetical protein